jgi:hypothetical protein
MYTDVQTLYVLASSRCLQTAAAKRQENQFNGACRTLVGMARATGYQHRSETESRRHLPSP